MDNGHQTFVRDIEHASAVAQLRNSYLKQAANLAPGKHIRLAKRTSNLFRFGSQPVGPGLDVSAFNRVLSVDTHARTADVQGMTTYEDLVDATLRHDLMPLVVPQLKTITLGGAVTGLGIESSSFRAGLPHESVREMEILTGSGDVLVANRSQHTDLFEGFPNSYGTLGYALRLTIDLAPVRRFVRLRHVRFNDARECAAAITEIAGAEMYKGAKVDFLDGTVFSPDEMYLTLGEFVDDAPHVSDYTGMNVYYRSIRQRTEDFLTTRDYLWRWDTDWFWCSGAFGVQNPLVRRVWPKKWLRSDVYHKIVGVDRRWGLSARLTKLRKQPPSEAVIQDVEVPVDELPRFLDEFHKGVGISPAWLCPVRASAPAPLYPLTPGKLYVNVGFWSGVPLQPGQAPDHHNRLVERLVSDCGGHKSLYSSVHYDEDEFWRRYNGDAYTKLKNAYDPDGRLLDLYHKVHPSE